MIDSFMIGVLSNIGMISFVALSAYLMLLVGEVSFGQQAFFGIGAYAAGIATVIWGWPLFVALVFGAACGGIAGSWALVVMTKATPAGAVLGGVSAAVIGGLGGFLTASFVEILRTSLREAIAAERRG